MKEHPIIMSGDNPKLILEGRKTQTRRIIRPQPRLQLFDHRFTWIEGGVSADTSKGWPCPYGVAGDRLWVREKHSTRVDFLESAEKPSNKRGIHYTHYFSMEPEFDPKDEMHWHCFSPWRPSIHMPRWASRITLEITKVRVERLQDISEDDAVAEGCFTRDGGWTFGSETLSSSPRGAYHNLWDSLHGKGAWDKNPWVWVIEFRKLPAAG